MYESLEILIHSKKGLTINDLEDILKKAKEQGVKGNTEILLEYDCSIINLFNAEIVIDKDDNEKYLKL